MSQEGAPNRRMRRAGVKGLQAQGVVLDPQGPPDGQRRYPLLNETILHHCGVNVVAMEGEALMLRFPSPNGLCVSVPLSSEGIDDLVKQIEAARAGQAADLSASVARPSDQPSAGPGDSER